MGVNKIRVAFPMAPLYTVVGAIVAAICVLLVTDSFVGFFVVMVLGTIVALVLSSVLGLQVRRQIADATQPGEPKPWIEWTWPRWTMRVARGYLVMMAAGAVITVVILIVAAVMESAR